MMKEKTKELGRERAIELENAREKIDITVPGEKIEIGHLHLLTRVQQEIKDFFESIGFSRNGLRGLDKKYKVCYDKGVKTRIDKEG